MKKLVLILLLLTFISCNSQDTNSALQLSISPAVKQSPENKAIISTLKLFLESKNNDSSENLYWKKNDFQKFPYPYAGIVNIEKGKLGPNSYQPALMEIIDTEDTSKKIVKLAFVGHNPQTQYNMIRTIYNIIANKDGNKIVFSSYLEYATSKWKQQKKSSITYYISPLKAFNIKDGDRQQSDITKLTTFFDCEPIPIRYYSCNTPVELFNIKGYDYNPMMYVSSTGGLAEKGNIIFSGNNSEYYTHEIVHVYTNSLYPNIPKIIDEGLATYFGGSGKFDYQFHKEQFRDYIHKNNIDYVFLIENPFERVYINDETPVPYILGAIICEKAINKMGKDQFLRILKEHPVDANVWDMLLKFGINKENLNSIIQKGN